MRVIYEQAVAQSTKSNRAQRDLLDALPVAIYETDAAGRITYYNAAAAELWGVKPELGKAEFCGSWKLYWPDGTPLPHDECPMAMALREKRPIRGVEALAERPDGVRIPFMPLPTPLFDEAGALTGAINVLVDISDRKRTAQNLAERTAQLALAEKTAGVGSFVNHLQTNTLQVSPGFVAIHGLPDGTTEISRSQWRANVNPVHPEELERLERVRDRTFRQRRGEYIVDYRINLPGRGVRWIEARSFVSYDTCGRAQRVVGVNIDVTERKKAENALQQREAELAEAQRLARIGSWSWDAATNILVGSDELSHIYGWNPADGMPSIRDQQAYYTVEDWERLKAAGRKTLETGVGYKLDVRAHRNGTPIWITARGEAARDAAGQIVGLRGTVQDITERKLAEQTLAERNAQLALAGKAGLVGTFAYDTNTEIMQISEGYVAIHGFPDGTTEIARSECLAGVHPEDMGRVEQLRSEAFCKGAREYSVEYRIVRRGGEVRWVETRCFISYNREGHPQRIVGVSIDITDRKRDEDQKSLLIAELDHRVKNILTCVAVVAQHSRDTTKSMEEFLEVLDGRLNSLANTHSLLSRSRWEGVSIAELVRGELAPCMKDGNTIIEGPEIVLAAEATQPVSMFLHELATNATKYGALSNSHGRVSVRWRIRSNGSSNRKLVLEWRETGGPPVAAPNTTGYGTSVIRDLIPYELGGTVDYELAAEGARCRLEIPTKWLQNSGGRVGSGVGRDAHPYP